MGFRFRKSFKIAPGVKLNVGKKSTGISIGGRAGGISFNSKTGTRARASIPGTGISYSSKIGGSSKKRGSSSKQSSDVWQSAMSKRPLPRRMWFFILALLFVFSGVIYCKVNVITGLITSLIGAVMLFVRYKTPDKKPYSLYQAQELLQRFDESMQIFMETEIPEDFFKRYEDATQAVSEMAYLTDDPICHGKTPQEELFILQQNKTEATNAFLDRYAKKIKLSAFEMTRGRKKKIETFKLVTGEYEKNMSAESIKYRDQVYEEICKNVEE